jgi:hypothetical protein
MPKKNFKENIFSVLFSQLAGLSASLSASLSAGLSVWLSPASLLSNKQRSLVGSLVGSAGLSSRRNVAAGILQVYRK